jgi:DNA-binding transcriptional MerR regulator
MSSSVPSLFGGEFNSGRDQEAGIRQGKTKKAGRKDSAQAAPDLFSMFAQESETESEPVIGPELTAEPVVDPVQEPGIEPVVSLPEPTIAEPLMPEMAAPVAEVTEQSVVVSEEVVSPVVEFVPELTVPVDKLIVGTTVFEPEPIAANVEPDEVALPSEANVSEIPRKEILMAEKPAHAFEEAVAEMQAEPQPEKIKKSRKAAEKGVQPDLPDNWKAEKQYYTIGEVASLFKVNTSHIRFWTNEFGLKVRTTRKGDRLFTGSQILELKAIHHLVKERGFKLAGAKARLKEQKKKEVTSVGLRESLTQLKDQLTILRNQLN